VTAQVPTASLRLSPLPLLSSDRKGENRKGKLSSIQGQFFFSFLIAIFFFRLSKANFFFFREIMDAG
jgi:hypothetical protein